MNTFTRFPLIILALLLGSYTTAQSNTVVDQVGRTVEITRPVQRVVTTFLPSTMFALSAGLKDALVGVSNKDSTLSVYGAVMADRSAPVLVGNRSVGLNLETIMSLRPDLVIMYGQKDGIRVADKLTALGIPAIVIMPETLKDMMLTLDLIGDAAGTRAHTDRVVAVMRSIQQTISLRTDTLPRYPKVYYATSRLLQTVSGDMLQNEMIARAGGINVSSKTKGFFVRITREQLLAWNPDTILCSGRLSDKELKSLYTPKFSALTAAQKQTIYRFPQGTFWDFPSPLSLAGVLWLSAQLHPQLYDDMDVQDEIDRLYDTIFGKDFSADHPYVVGRSH